MDLGDLVRAGGWADAQNYVGRGWRDGRIVQRLGERYSEAAVEVRRELVSRVRQSRLAAQLQESLHEGESLDPTVIPEVPGLPIGSFLVQFKFRQRLPAMGVSLVRVGRVITPAPPTPEQVREAIQEFAQRMIEEYGLSGEGLRSAAILWLVQSPRSRPGGRGG